MATHKRVKILRSHTALAQFLNQCEVLCHIAKIKEIRTPYVHSDTTPLYLHTALGPVFIAETSQRRFEVFQYDNE